MCLPCCVDDDDLRGRINSGIIIGLFWVGCGILILAVEPDGLVAGIFAVSMGGIILLATFIICGKEWYLARHI